MIAQYYNDPIKLARKLIGYKSISPQDGGAIDFLSDFLQSLDCKIHIKSFDGVKNIYARYADKTLPNLCFSGHIDVVPPSSNSWKYDPFDPVIENGILYGRGAVDMKGAIAAFLCAMARYITNTRSSNVISLSALITSDEEIDGLCGTKPMMKWLITECKEILSGCIVTEPTNNDTMGENIKIGRRGSVNFNLSINGTQGHVAYPENAKNPIDDLIIIVHKLSQLQFDKGTDVFQATKLQFTSLDVGNKVTNIIPSAASASFNIRYNTLHDSSSLHKTIQSICKSVTNDFQLSYSCFANAFITSDMSFVRDVGVKAIEEIYNKPPLLTTYGGTSDARFIKEYCPVFEYGLINKTAHMVNERVATDDIIELCDTYYKMILRFEQFAKMNDVRSDIS